MFDLVILIDYIISSNRIRLWPSIQRHNNETKLICIYTLDTLAYCVYKYINTRIYKNLVLGCCYSEQMKTAFIFEQSKALNKFTHLHNWLSIGALYPYGELWNCLSVERVRTCLPTAQTTYSKMKRPRRIIAKYTSSEKQKHRVINDHFCTDFESQYCATH